MTTTKLIVSGIIKYSSVSEMDIKHTINIPDNMTAQAVEVGTEFLKRQYPNDFKKITNITVRFKQPYGETS